MSTILRADTLAPKDSMLHDESKAGMAGMPVEIAGAVNLMAHPLAGMAAMSAIGFGLAGQAMGLWLGTLSGAVAASQRLFSPTFDEHEIDAFRDALSQPTPAEAGAAKLAQVVEATVVPLVPRVGKGASQVLNAKEVVSLPSSVDADAKAALRQKIPMPRRSAVKAEAKPQPTTGRRTLDAGKPLAAVIREAKAKPVAIEKPEQPDDLKAITGLGPKVEQVLNGLGIWTYPQIAAWSDAEIAWVDDMLGFGGRIQRDEWLGQAKSLATAKG